MAGVDSDLEWLEAHFRRLHEQGEDVLLEERAREVQALRRKWQARLVAVGKCGQAAERARHKRNSGSRCKQARERRSEQRLAKFRGQYKVDYNSRGNECYCGPQGFLLASRLTAKRQDRRRAHKKYSEEHSQHAGEQDGAAGRTPRWVGMSTRPEGKRSERRDRGRESAAAVGSVSCARRSMRVW